jgi:hypothetical protein
MNEQIKNTWIAALLSGLYTQSTGRLRTEIGFCCLGVLCDLAAKEGVGEWTPPDKDGRRYFRPSEGPEEGGVLPRSVMKWAGIQSEDPAVGVVIEGRATCLSELNDKRMSFSQLADVIADKWSVL